MKNEIMERPIEYVTDTGTEVKLTAGMVRHFLVSGKSELATDQEIIYFMKLCQARKLNPFLKECYLIKYDNSPAAIITARSTFQNNARMSDDCQGWKFGVIVQDDKGFVKRTAGLVLDNQKIVGGWFSAKPKGWDEPFELEVNLSHYIKTTQTGRPTQFWTPEKQAGMIAKVAEVQGLRTLWGKNTAGMYEADEIVGNGDTVGFPKPKIDTDDTGYKGIPSMSYLPEDFDKEFEAEIADPEWKDFWQKSVDWHAHQKPPKTGAELKIDIIKGGHEQIGRVRAAFITFVTEKQTEKGGSKAEKPTQRKRRTKKEIEADKRKKELEEQAKMLESEAWIGCQAYAENYPEIYEIELNEVTGGDPPKTVKECKGVVDRCQAALQAKEPGDDS